MTTLAASHATAPSASATPATVSPAEADGMVRAGRAIIVDVREPDEIRRASVSSFVPVPSSVCGPDRFPPQAEGKRMLVLCQRGGRATSVAKALLAAGRTDVSVIAGGMTGWISAGMPVVRGSGGIPVIRQVMIAAGSMVAGFTALGAFVNPWFLAGAGFVGAGLAFAGISGICPMAKALGAMPWNAPKPRPAPPAQATAAPGSGSCSSTGGSCGCR